MLSKIRGIRTPLYCEPSPVACRVKDNIKRDLSGEPQSPSSEGSWWRLGSPVASHEWAVPGYAVVAGLRALIVRPRGFDSLGH